MICFTTFQFSQRFDRRKSFWADGARRTFEIVSLEGIILSAWTKKGIKTKSKHK